MNRRLRAIVLISGSCLVAGTSVGAQEADTLRQRYLVSPPPPPPPPAAATVSRAAPGVTVGTPVAFGADWGDVYVGAVGVNRQRYYPPSRGRRNLDGAVVAGVGLGNAEETVGLELSAASYSTFRRGFFTRMGVSVKAHRMLPANLALAVGVENALVRGPVDAERSTFAVISRGWTRGPWNPFRGVTASVGVGNGRFRSEDDWLADRNTIGYFFNAAVYLADPISVIADYNQDLNLGISIVPIPGIPLSITGAVLDVTGRAGDGRRYSIGVGTGHSFR